MSFVYIDSQGREVNIPSVDAVRLRIELGAIKDQTRFFDSNTGKWAPAAEHEIYRTLKRQLMEAEHGFVAPPPSVASAGVPAAGEDPPSVGAVSSSDDEADPAPPETESIADPDAGVDDLAGFGDVHLLATDAEAEEAGSPVGDADDLWATVEPDRERRSPSSQRPPEEAVDESRSDVERGGGVEGSFVTSVEDELMGELVDQGSAGDLDDRSLDLEPSLADSFTGPPPGRDPGPVAQDDRPGDTPGDEVDAGWDAVGEEAEDGLAPDDAGDDLGALWESPEDHGPEPASESEVAANDLFAEGESGVEYEPPASRAGGAPPQRKLTRARTPGAERIIGMAALVVALGAAAFFGWRFLAPTLGGLGSGEPEIVMPPLDAELVPRMRQLAGRASERMAQDMLELPELEDVPQEPSEDWLAGIYLASASQYPNVPEYWSAIGEWVDASQVAENALFREALRAQLDTANLAASDSEAIRDRALAGFQAAGSDRRIVYDQMREVAARSVELHEFLLANEGQVTYEPAGSGVSRDPVLEAVPATDDLGDEMWDRVASITNAMDALGYLDRIDTERLLGVFLEKLEATAIW